MASGLTGVLPTRVPVDRCCRASKVHADPVQIICAKGAGRRRHPIWVYNDVICVTTNRVTSCYQKRRAGSVPIKPV